MTMTVVVAKAAAAKMGPLVASATVVVKAERAVSAVNRAEQP